MSNLRILSVVFCLCLSAGLVQAQTPAVQPPADPELAKKKEAMEQTRRRMIDEMIEVAHELRLPENQSYLLCIAGAQLWPSDEKRARELFQESIQLYHELQRQTADGSEPIIQSQRGRYTNLRQHLLQMISQRDPQLGQEFLEATRGAGGQSSLEERQREAWMESSMLQQIAARDPKRALERAEKLMAEGASVNSIWPLVYALQNKDPEGAQKLTAALIEKAQTGNSNAPDSQMFLIRLIGDAMRNEATRGARLQAMTGVGQQTMITAGSARTPLLSVAQAQALAEKLIADLQKELAVARQQMDPSRAQRIFSNLRNLRMQTQGLDKQMPAFTASLQKALETAEQMLPPQQRGYEALNRLAEKGSVEGIVEAAANVPQDVRPQYYQRAAQIAMGKGNLEEARRILKEHVPDKAQQQSMLDELERQQVWKKIGERQSDEALNLNVKFRNVNEHVNWLISMAQNAKQRENSELAQQLLDQAYGLVAGPPASNTQLFAQLRLAGAYASHNADRSFEILESSIEKVNELAAASAVIEEFQENGSYRNKEMILLNGGGMSSQYIHQYTPALANLFIADPERVHKTFQRVSRPELRVWMQANFLQQSSGSSMYGRGELRSYPMGDAMPMSIPPPPPRRIQ